MVSNSQVVDIVYGKASFNSPNPSIKKISSENLVPGDIVAVHGKYHVFCDALLLNGTCIVDESSLTGESVPVNKQGIDHCNFNASLLNSSASLFTEPSLKKSALFNGTNVLKVASNDGTDRVYAIVISTGFYTLKGQLLRSIIRPETLTFKFFRDSLKFLLVVALMALLGFAYTVYVLNKGGVAAGHIALNALDVITIVVSPMLPIALSTGILLALRRLKRKSIYCTDISRITSCGKIKLVCFDKTGTLTENNLQVRYLHCSSNGKFSTQNENVTTITDKIVVWALASCHSLCNIDNEVTGDPLELSILKFSNYSLASDDTLKDMRQTTLWPFASLLQDIAGPSNIIVFKRFPFEFELKRMSVLACEQASQELFAFVKGSPEIIAQFCSPQSIPANFNEQLFHYTKLGYRIIAYAWKSMGCVVDYDIKSIPELTRAQLEFDLNFCGFAVLENPLQAYTTPVIRELHTANIKMVMLTGDHLNTAVHVAKKCGLLLDSDKIIKISRDQINDFFIEYVMPFPEEAPKSQGVATSIIQSNSLTCVIDMNTKMAKGDEIEKFISNFEDEQIVITSDDMQWVKLRYSSFYKKLLVHTKVCARASPSQKTEVVQDLKSVGYTTLMCGDGANDCSALKEADAGISLSESEASIAAPFTSQVQNISCVPYLIREGHAALATSFCCFKFVALYSLIQFVTVLILFSISSNLSDYQFLFIDVCFGLGLVAVLVEAGPNFKLAMRRPLGRLFHPAILVSVFSQLGIHMLFQLICFHFIRSVSWYKQPSTFESSEEYELYVKCQENTVLFTISSFQYVIVGVAYADGPPFRQSSLLSVKFVSSVLVLTVMIAWIAVHPGRFAQEIFMLVPIPHFSFSLLLLVIALANAVVAIAFEKYVMSSYVMKSFLRKLVCKKEPRNEYKTLSRKLK